MRNYHDIYLKTDVLLLADIFQSFRENALDKYGLDLLWYYSTPGLAWDALFLTTGQKLELITDQDMYMMIEQDLREEIFMVSRRYTKANNPGIGKGKWVADIVDASIVFQIIAIYGFILKHSNCDIVAYLRPWIAISKV